MAKLKKQLQPKPELKPIKRAAGYVRVSSVSQIGEQKTSLGNQENVIKKYCEDKGWTLTEIYEDAGKSGKSMKARTEMQRLLLDAKKNEFQVVVTWDVTRFGRSVLDTKRNLDELEKLNIHLIAINDGIDTSQKNKLDNLKLNFLATIAEYEAETIRERTEGGLIRLLEKREVVPGHTPYGYYWDKKLKQVLPHPEESGRLTWMVAEYLKGVSLFDLAAKLNEQNTPCSRRGKWHSATISNLFHQEVYFRGVMFVNFGKVKYDFPCKPLILNTQWKELQERLKQANTRAGRPALAAQDFLLHRLLLCGVCNSKLITRNGSPKRVDGTYLQSYTCAYYEKSEEWLQGRERCSFHRVNADDLENHVMEELCRVIRGEHFHRYEESARIERERELAEECEYLTRQLAKEEIAREEFVVALRNGLSGARFAALDKEAEEKIITLNSALSEAKQKLDDIRGRRTQEEEFLRFRAEHHVELHFLTMKIMAAPFALKQKLLRGFIDGKIIVPVDNYRKMKILWRLNLPLLKEVLAEIPPLEPGPGGRGHTEMDKLIWVRGKDCKEQRKPINRCESIRFDCPPHERPVPLAHYKQLLRGMRTPGNDRRLAANHPGACPNMSFLDNPDEGFQGRVA